MGLGDHQQDCEMRQCPKLKLKNDNNALNYDGTIKPIHELTSHMGVVPIMILLMLFKDHMQINYQ